MPIVKLSELLTVMEQLTIVINDFHNNLALFHKPGLLFESLKGGHGMGKWKICLVLAGALTTSLWASTYRPATIASVHQESRTESDNILHNTLLDSTIIIKTELVYVFEVRCADEVHVTEYVYPGKLQDAPKNWKTQVEVRTQGNRMFIKDLNGNELETRIVRHTKP